MKHQRRKFLRNTLLTGLAAGLSGKGLHAAWPKENPQSDLSHHTDGSEHSRPGSGLLTLLQSTDVHCQVHPHDELFWENDGIVFRSAGGYAHLAALFEQTRAENPNTFIVDTGDMFQGSELSVKTMGKAFLPILDALGYDLYIPGNWEVVYGKKNMQSLLGGLGAPKVCANMYHDLGAGKKGELVFPPYFTWTRLGVKIGFIGLTDHLVPIRQSPEYSKGIIYTKPEESLSYWTGVLREQEQCDRVIVLAHLGLSQQIALANNEACQGVDWIFGGDTHERVREPIQCRFSKVVEPGAFGSFVGRLDIQVTDGKITRETYALVEVSPELFPAKADVSTLIAELEKPFKADIERVIGYSSVPLYRYFVVENTIDTLVLDALRWQVDTDIVLSNGFRFCPPRNVGPDGRAPITEGYLFDMLPVDSTVRIGKVTGQQLTEWLERELNNVFAQNASERFGGWVVKFSGMQVDFLAFGQNGKRVQRVTVQGKPLDPMATYSIAACEREGDPPTTLCRIKHVKDARNTPYTLHGTMKAYLAAHPLVTPTPRGNAKALDAPETLLTQVTGVPYTFR